MSLSQVRSYIRTALTGMVGHAFYEHKEATDLGDVPRNKFQKAWQLNYDQISSKELNDLFIDDSFSCTLKIYYKANKHNSDEMDLAIDLAHDVRLELIRPIASMSGTNIKNVICNSITPKVIDTNENMIEVAMALTFRMVFKGDRKIV